MFRDSRYSQLVKEKRINRGNGDKAILRVNMKQGERITKRVRMKNRYRGENCERLYQTEIIVDIEQQRG